MNFKTILIIVGVVAVSFLIYRFRKIVLGLIVGALVIGILYGAGWLITESGILEELGGANGTISDLAAIARLLKPERANQPAPPPSRGGGGIGFFCAGVGFTLFAITCVIGGVIYLRLRIQQARGNTWGAQGGHGRQRALPRAQQTQQPWPQTLAGWPVYDVDGEIEWGGY